MPKANPVKRIERFLKPRISLYRKTAQNEEKIGGPQLPMGYVIDCVNKFVAIK
jgi:hypothetical protein